MSEYFGVHRDPEYLMHYGRKGMKRGMNIFNPDYVPYGQRAMGENTPLANNPYRNPPAPPPERPKTSTQIPFAPKLPTQAELQAQAAQRQEQHQANLHQQAQSATTLTPYQERKIQMAQDEKRRREEKMAQLREGARNAVGSAVGTVRDAVYGKRDNQEARNRAADAERRLDAAKRERARRSSLSAAARGRTQKSLSDREAGIQRANQRAATRRLIAKNDAYVKKQTRPTGQKIADAARDVVNKAKTYDYRGAANKAMTTAKNAAEEARRRVTTYDYKRAADQIRDAATKNVGRVSDTVNELRKRYRRR